MGGKPAPERQLPARSASEGLGQAEPFCSALLASARQDCIKARGSLLTFELPHEVSIRVRWRIGPARSPPKFQEMNQFCLGHICSFVESPDRKRFLYGVGLAVDDGKKYPRRSLGHSFVLLPIAQ